ncbi:serine hydrolase [Aeromicrobium wangtongii]|uniref:Serine hydrolase n=1 Tax=Aeromicrobium wangtongii TaxID=2969247 RepID=A0ABY5M7E1_9ACTN|nr:serine hydrolase [Aeromicrobium wangtongii]MCD9199115.1 serine hydrolase [Aeromicrobium wangtongii]UUP12854.1 serine hydrolase [Aeromicrobium wangtongii]
MTRRMSIDDLTAIAVPSQPALSPDGSQVAYVLRTLDTEHNRNHDEVWLVPAAGGRPERLTAGPEDTAPAWSPDGSQLAFLRAGQVHVLTPGGGEPRRLTDLSSGAGAPVWSPDGQRLAFTAPVDPTDGSGPLVASRLDYQTDGAGMFGAVRHQLHVLDVVSGSCRQVTDGVEHAGQPAWAPDGRTLAFTRRIGEDSDLTFRTGVLLLDVDDRLAVPHTVALADGVAGTVAYDTDGEHLLVVGHPGDPVGHQHLLRVPLAGGEPVSLTAHLDRNVMAGAPAYPGGRPQRDAAGRLLFCIRDRGCTHVWTLDDPAAPEGRALLDGADRVVSGLSVVGDTAVVALATATSYGEIVALDLVSGEETVLTDHGAALAGIEMFRPEARTFSIADGTDVQAWLLRDPEREGPRPLLLDVHGGPHNAWNGAADEMHPYHQELVERGWAVLLVNPRGSDGYGEAFFDGVNGAWGVADAQDFLQPIDALVAEGVADPDRLAVTGYSYGGFMTGWLTGHDDRFKAGVAGGIVSDLVSEFGTADDGTCLSTYELGGAPWDDPPNYAAMSPLTNVANVTTPTLVLHGLADLTCPVGQAQQWHSALRSRGVPTELVLYPGASHAFILLGPPSQRLDYAHRVVDWVEQHTLRAGRARIDTAHWERRLSQLAERYGVPGVQLGVLRLDAQGDDEMVVASHGVLNVDTGAPVTADSVFQIGSITKVWTATVVMQLVDEGLADLDAPVVEILPDLTLSDPEVTKQVTLRHLLTHTSGIDGDVFTDTGRGDDCLEKYVALLEGEAQNHPLGATWSYCNSGFSVLGLVIERLTGTTWDQALRDRIFTPLQMKHALTLPEDALLHAAAVGHLTVDDRPQVAPIWQLPRSIGPAGLVAASAPDVLAFARLHMAGGVAPDGTRLLSEASAAAMSAHQADLPDKYSLGDSWGLGWIRFGWDGQRLYGHDGNTIGQSAFLRVLPEAGLAVTMLTNSDSSRDLYEALYREIVAELAGVTMPRPIAPPEPAVDVDIAPYVGRYERSSVIMEVFVADGEPWLRTTLVGPLAEMVPDPVDEYPLVPFSENVFVTKPPEAETWAPVTFFELPTGERYLHFGVRATPRVS